MLPFRVACAPHTDISLRPRYRESRMYSSSAETTAPFRSAHTVPDRATGTFPRACRGRARRWSMCGR